MLELDINSSPSPKFAPQISHAVQGNIAGMEISGVLLGSFNFSI